jgi:lipopolysaccharide heptosyltransferase II
MRLTVEIKKIIKTMIFSLLERLAPILERNRPLDKEKIHKILVAEGGGIGDLMRVLPAIECLRANLPTAAISLLASPGAKGILCLFPKREIIADVIDYDLQQRHNSFLKKLRLVRCLRKRGYDLVYSPDRGEGMREKVLMSFLTGAPHRIGFTTGRVGFLHTIKREFRNDEPILKQNLALLEVAGLKINQDRIALRVPERARLDMRRYLERPDHSLPSPMIALHPGASWRGEYRSWPLHRYIALVECLRQELGATIIVIGNQHETPMADRFREQLQDPAVVDATGKTTIAQMAAIIQLSDLFIGNDSGPLHVALALNTPTVAIFGITSPEQVLSEHQHCTVIQKNPPFSPLYLHEYNFTFRPADMASIDSVAVNDVMEGVRQALARRMG